jgi:hypothetical protein
VVIDAGYRPRNPETTVLYQVVAEQLETVLARQQARDRPVPRFVEKEFRTFLDCGILARGFLRLHCQGCGQGRLLAFSCKARVWCPSCGGRRMSDTAAHLVDRVFTNRAGTAVGLIAAFRAALPHGLRCASHRDVLNVFIRAVFGELRLRARDPLGLRSSQCGAVTFIQLYGDALNCNLHFHCLVIGGVYASGEDGRPEFHELPAPGDEDVIRLTTLVSQRIQ